MNTNHDTYSADDLTAYEIRLHFNTVICLFVNILTVYCILVHSTKAMGVYKWYLLVIQMTTALFDFHFSFIAAPFPTFPIPGFCAAGIWSRHWGYVWGEIVQVIFVHWFLSFQGMAISYGIMYRYKVISEKMEWMDTTWGRILIVILPFIYPIPAGTLLIACISDKDVILSFISQEAPEMLQLYTTEPCNSIVYSTTASLYFLVAGTEVLILCCVNISFSLMTYTDLLKKKHFLSEASFRMQKQLLISLVFQFFVPFFFIIIPLASLICFQIMAIHSCGNGLVMIMTITPYRQAVLNFLRCGIKIPVKPSLQQKAVAINSHISGIPAVN